MVTLEQASTRVMTRRSLVQLESGVDARRVEVVAILVAAADDKQTGADHVGTAMGDADPLRASGRQPAMRSTIPQPDPDGQLHRITLPGDIPNPEDPPTGCPFHTRCPEAMERCADEIQEAYEIGRGGRQHWVRCHLYDGSIQGK